MRTPPGNDLNLGYLVGRRGMLTLPRTLRDKHLYVCGATGAGKSKFLENLIRQDIMGWRKSRSPVIVLDPHGSLYDNLINWLAWHKIDRPIVPIDLRQNDWIVSYNLLRQRSTADPAVLVDNLIDAMAYVWGESGTDATPRLARWAGHVIRALYEKKLTLIEAEYLVDHMGKELRYAITADLKDKSTRHAWRFADTLNPKDFEAELGSIINRLQRFIRNQTLRTIFGQGDVSLDLGRALEEGWIILVSLATEGAKVSKENAELFATLLLSDLWTAAQERGKRDGIKPAYCYMDEFQRFVSPTISDNLDEARGYGLCLTLAHQFPNQLLDRGEHGKRVYNSIMENASSKVVFRLSHDENLRAMAQWLFMGVMNPDEVKHELYSTKVMEYREELKETYGHTTASAKGGGKQRGHASGSGSGGTTMFPLDESEGITSDSWSQFAANSESDSNTWSDSESESRTLVPTIVPILGKELSHIQFRSLEEQLFRSMAVLFDQEQRQAVGRLLGMRAPVSIYTPNVTKKPGGRERTEEYLTRCYDKLPFALRRSAADKQMAERAEHLVKILLPQAAGEPSGAKRRILKPPDK